ncbi:LysR family transcriptional regulator [Roseomonas sp. USHLN139]|uniref:LysR family transcriptional regulator n=1 Tax=Roseomonas sp. USHLN139 TaxID=3081298 RepID=UPI003B019AF7
MIFDLREMAVFRRVMELGSVTAAAAALNVSQPAVTRMLQKAEQRLGFSLFIREKRRLRPTPEAQLMFPETLGAFAALEQVQRLAGELRAGRAGILAISCIPALAASLLAPAIQRFRARRPEASVTLQSFGAHEVIERIAAQKDDLGFIIGPVGHDALLVDELGTSELTCLLPPDHPLALKKSLGPAELAGQPLLCPGRHLVLGEQLARAFAEANFPFRIAVEVSQAEAVCALVRAGAGIGLLSGFGLRGAKPADLVARPFRPAIVSTARLLRPRLRPLSRLAQGFVEALGEG